MIRSEPPRRPTGLAFAALAAIVVAHGAGFDAAKTDLNIQYDKAFSFSGPRTWSWHPEGAGDVRLALSSEADPKRIAERVDPVIIPAVEREMTARGYARTADTASLYVHYYMLATIGQSAQTHGQFLPAVPEWGLPPFAPSTSALSIYPVGTLILDITSAATNAIVWRGAASREISLDKSAEERRKVLDKAIRDLLAKFPPKK